VTEIVTVDIGGTNTRFAIAELTHGAITLQPETVLPTGQYRDLQSAWAAFVARLCRPAPRGASLCMAGPVVGEVLELTNQPWIIRPGVLAEQLNLDRLTLINDFVAVAHAVANVGPEFMAHVCGPDVPLPTQGPISIVGPGTGLGVGLILRLGPQRYHVLPSEGGHVSFAPVDAFEDRLLARMRTQYSRVSTERVASGPGLTQLYAALAAEEGRAVELVDDRTLWTRALSGDDPLGQAAMERFCMILGAHAGDMALTTGARGVVIAGGLGLRLRDVLPRSGFAQRFAAKGRFEAMMQALPVKLITHGQPGLLGAAAAFVQEHGAN
jgi:glucokinase